MRFSTKQRYSFYIILLVCTILVKMVLVLVNIRAQERDAEVINLAGRQRMLSQNIAKHALMQVVDGSEERYPREELSSLAQDFRLAHVFLDSINRTDYEDDRVAELIQQTTPLVAAINVSCMSLVNERDSTSRAVALKTISESERAFLPLMEEMVYSLENLARQKVSNSANVLILLTFLTLLVLVIEFVFFMVPFFNGLVSKNKELEELNRQLRDYAQITSHNLRAPVSNLVTLNQFIKDAQTEEEKMDLLAKLSDVIDGLIATLDVLLEVLMAEVRVGMSVEDISLQQVFDNTMAQLSAEVLEANVQIKVDFQVSTVRTNRVYLESIFVNLLSNALKFRQEGRPLVVEVIARKKDKKLELLFKDTGSGIDMQRYGSKLFGIGKIFHRNIDSKGYGLFLTKGHVKAMGGEIEASLNKKHGMVFKVTLPFR